MAANHKTMTAAEDPSSASPTHLARLAEICREAGAAASTVIYSQGKAVVFYKDPRRGGCRDSNSFDELHILNTEKACILIAVFEN